MQNYPERESICKMIKTTLSDTEWGSAANFLSIVPVILEGKLEASMQQKLEILQECLQGQSSWEKTFHDFSCLFPSLELDLANYKDFLEASLQYEMQSYNEFLCEMFPWLTPVKATDMQTMDAAQKFILQRNRLTIVQAEILQDSRHAICNQIKDKIGLQIIPLGNCKEYLYNPYYFDNVKSDPLFYKALISF